MTEGKTLTELNVQPGDVVRNLYGYHYKRAMDADKMAELKKEFPNV